jgi:hypothetical protein
LETLSIGNRKKFIYPHVKESEGISESGFIDSDFGTSHPVDVRAQVVVVGTSMMSDLSEYD